MIVVDTNIIAYLYLSGQHSKQVERLFAHDPIWCAPYLWRSEFRNVLALYLRKKIISLSDTIQITEEAERLLQGNEYTVSSFNVMKFVQLSNCSAYDCEFAALASELAIPLVTEDKKLHSAFPKLSISINQYLLAANKCEIATR